MIKAIICVVALSVLVVAQRPARTVTHLGVGAEACGTDTGLLTCLLGPSAGVQTGVAAPGALHALAGDEFLVAGRDSVGNGLLEHWKIVAGAFQMQGSLAIPGLDFSGVAYDASGDKLYLLDCSGDLIIRADWDAVSALPTAWTSWATVTDVPGLQKSDESYRGFSAAANGMPAQVYLGPYPDLYDVEATLISGEPGSIPMPLSSYVSVKRPKRAVNAAALRSPPKWGLQRTHTEGVLIILNGCG